MAEQYWDPWAPRELVTPPEVAPAPPVRTALPVWPQQPQPQQPTPPDQIVWTDRESFEPPPPEPRSLPGEIYTGAIRGAGNQLVIPGMRALDWAARGAAELSGNQAVQEFIEPKQARINQMAESFNKDLAPSVAGATDVRGVGDAARLTASTLGEAVPMLIGGLAGYGIAGVTGATAYGVVQGMLQGATEAAHKHGGDPYAAATGAMISGTANGIPMPFWFSAGGQGFVKQFMKSVGPLIGINEAELYAEPLTGVAAGKPYETPTGEQAVNVGVASAITGGAIGAGAAALTRRGPQTTQANPISTGVAPDHAAALGDQMQGPMQPGPWQGPMQPAPVQGPMQPGPWQGPVQPRQAPGIPPAGTPEPVQQALPGMDVLPVERVPARPVEAPLPPSVARVQPEPAALPAPDLARGIQGEGFTVQREPVAPIEPTPARPSDGMNRGNMTRDLVDNFGQTRSRLLKMPIEELRTEYDRVKAPPEPAPTAQEFRPTEPVVGTVPTPDLPAVPPEPTPRSASGLEAARARTMGAVDEVSSDAQLRPVGGTDTAPVDGTARDDGLVAAAERGGAADNIAGVRAEPVAVAPEPTTDMPIAALVDTGMTPAQAVRTRAETQRELRTQKMAPTKGEQPASRLTAEQIKAGLRKKGTPEATRKPETVIREEPAEALSEFIAEQTPQAFERGAGTPVQVARDAGTPAETGRAPRTSNLDRPLTDLESEIIAGRKTGVEASEEHGTHAGRARPENRTMQAWLEHRIPILKNRDNRARVEREAARLKADQKLSPADKRAAAKDLADELLKFHPKNIQKLQKALDDIKKAPKPDPNRVTPEEAAESEARTKSALDVLNEKLGKIEAAKKPRESHSQVAFKNEPDAREQKPMRDILEDSHAKNEPRSIHDYLDAIVNDPVLRAKQPEAVKFARWLKKVSPKDLQVMSQETAADLLGDPDFKSAFSAGQYWPPGRPGQPELITLNRSTPFPIDHLETLLHEGLHSVTTPMLRALPPSSKAHQALTAIRNELTRGLDTGKFDSEDLQRLQHAISTNFEAHTMLMTSPVTQQLARGIEPSRAFQKRMAELGYPTGEVKSLWRSFTDWVRKLVGMPRDISNSLFDQVAKPLLDISNEAVRYNRANPLDPSMRQVLPKDPALRRIATPVAEGAYYALPIPGKHAEIDAAIKKGVTWVDLKRVDDTIRRTLLQLAHLDTMVSRYKELTEPVQLKDADGKPRVDATGKPVMSHQGNPLERFRAAFDAERERVKNLRVQFDPVVRDLITRIKGPERDTISTLMNEATIGEVQLGKGADNSHLTTKAELAELAKQQKIYDGLSSEGRQLYDDWRDHYKKTYAIDRKAELTHLIRSAFPEASKAETDALVKAAGTKKGLRELIDKPDASDVARAFGSRWEKSRALAREMARVYDMGFVQGDYFPLRRYGDYVITYGDKTADNYGVEFFERRSEADARRAELVKAGLDPSDVQSKRDMSHLHAVVPESLLDGVNTALNRSGFTAEQKHAVRDAFATSLLQHGARSAARISRTRRLGIAGASKDVERILANEFLQFSNRIGYLEHGPDRQDALREIQRHADYLGRTREDGSNIVVSAIARELGRRAPVDDIAPGSLTQRMRQLTPFGFVYSLMSPSQAFVNTMEAHANAASHIGGRYNPARATAALAKAMRQVSPGLLGRGWQNTKTAMNVFGDGLKAADWDLTAFARDQFLKHEKDPTRRQGITDVFKAVEKSGLIDYTPTRELQEIARGGSVTRGWWGRFIELESAMQHAIDSANKAAIVKAAWDLEYGKTKDSKGAQDYAIEMLRRSMPNNTRSNRPRISTEQGVLGAFAAPVMQFRNYGLHQYGVMANLLKESIKGASPEAKHEAQLAFAYMMGTRALMAGTLTWFADPLRWLGGIWDFITGAEKPRNRQVEWRKTYADIFGPTLGEIIARGPLRAAGMDVHHRTGMDNMLNFPDLRSYSVGGFMEAFGTAFSGVAGQDALKIAEGGRKLINGDMKGLIDFVPVRMARDLAKAGFLATEGVTDRRGKTILPPEQISPLDVGYQAIGIQPRKLAELREKRTALLQKRGDIASEKSKLVTAWVTADRADKAAAMREIQDYNRKHPGTGITRGSLVAAEKRAKDSTKDLRTAGLVLPKRNAREIIEAGSFANVR